MYITASEVFGSMEAPSAESLVSWLLEHPQAPQEDSDSESNSYDTHSDTDSMSDEFGELDSFEVSRTAQNNSVNLRNIILQSFHCTYK